MTPRLALSGITKRYATTLANDGIDLSVAPGAIHALLGENGAGKSTLVKIIYGAVQPDAGGIAWEGRPVAIASPHAARALGIGMVFQHFSLFESLTVVENIALGLETRESLRDLASRIVATSARYGLSVTPGRHVNHLSVGERQRVEIVRCLLGEPKLLIMDEPTSVLTPQEATSLFDVLRRLAREGCSILYISHKLEEIAALCEAATVLRAGRVVGSCDPRVTAPQRMAEMMTGGVLPVCRRNDATVTGPAALSVHGLSLSADTPFGTSLRDVVLEVRPGEIVGIAGVAGNGQSELLAALSGERAAPARSILLGGIGVGARGAAARRRAGLGFIPEERLGRGLVGEMSLADNAMLTGWVSGLAPRGLLRLTASRRRAAELIARFRVRAAGPGAQARSLSGGNAQKFIVGREVASRPRVLLAAHPTWGVDVGAALAIRQTLLDLAAEGTAILLVSEDLSELLEICDRIGVLFGGRLGPVLPTAQLTAESVGLMMGGYAPAAAPSPREPVHAA